LNREAVQRNLVFTTKVKRKEELRNKEGKNQRKKLSTQTASTVVPLMLFVLKTNPTPLISV